MDLDDQATIQQVVDKVGKEDLVVLLGSPSPESAELYAATVTMGDPTFAGPLAGIPLGLPVFHILEPEIVSQLPADVYAERLQMAALTLETEPIFEVVQRIRSETVSA